MWSGNQTIVIHQKIWCTLSMVKLGQLYWDDIKILGHQVGHLISKFWAKWDTNHISHTASPNPSSFVWILLNQYCFTINTHIKEKHITIEVMVIHNFMPCMGKIWVKKVGQELGHWYQNLRENPGTLISKKSLCPNFKILSVPETWEVLLCEKDIRGVIVHTT